MVIKEHTKITCKKLMNEEKQRLKKKLKETRKRATNVRLGYFHPPLWENVVKYSDNEDHKHRFKVGSQNREKVETLYTSGAKSFESVEIIIRNLLNVQFYM